LTDEETVKGRNQKKEGEGFWFWLSEDDKAGVRG
jgi:hypothetical protein